jgi:hypothetical protein
MESAPTNVELWVRVAPVATPPRDDLAGFGDFAYLTTGSAWGYAASVMEETAKHPPVVELPETSGRASASWLSSFYYWFTNPPALLAGQFG